jgi:hypothetical protein
MPDADSMTTEPIDSMSQDSMEVDSSVSERIEWNVTKRHPILIPTARYDWSYLRRSNVPLDLVPDILLLPGALIWCAIHHSLQTHGVCYAERSLETLAWWCSNRPAFEATNHCDLHHRENFSTKSIAKEIIRGMQAALLLKPRVLIPLR